jgi:hypothetical protein
MFSLALALALQTPSAAPIPPPVSPFQLACVKAGGAIGALKMSPPTYPDPNDTWHVPLYDGPPALITVSIRSTVVANLQDTDSTNPKWSASLYDSYGRTFERQGPIFLNLVRPRDRPIEAEWCLFVRPLIR